MSGFANALRMMHTSFSFLNIIEVKDKLVQHHFKINLDSNNKNFIFSAKYSWSLTEHLIGSFVIPQQESLQVYNVHYIYYLIYTCILRLRQPQISLGKAFTFSQLQRSSYGSDCARESCFYKVKIPSTDLKINIV